jgi:PAS domain S-box-containing protein
MKESGLSRERALALADAVVDAADAAGIGVVVTRLCGPEPINVYVSLAAETIIGRPREQLLGPSFAFTPSDEMPRMLELSERAQRREPVPARFETVIARADGTRVPIEVSVSQVSIYGELAAVSFIMDVSARKQAELALLRSEASFRKLVESAPLAVWIMDERGMRYANPAAVALFGFESVDQVIGLDPHAVTHPDDVQELEQRARAMLRRRERLPAHEYRAQRRDGTWMVLEVSSIAIDYEGDSAILSFGRDLTERKKIEAQVLQSDRLAALGMLAGGMAHAINNPLTYVLLNLDHVARQLLELGPGADPAEVVARLNEAYQGAERIAGVVRQMRVFTRSDEQIRGPVDVRRVLDTAIAMVGNEIRHRGDLVVAYSDVPPVSANRALLEQAFLNLLLYAAQSLPDDASGGELRVSVRTEDSQVVLEVSDNGPGMDPEQLEQLFEPILAPHETGDRTELGLAICRGIVTSMRGEMRVESEPGKGTTFRILLPASSAGAAQSVLPIPPASSVPPPAPNRARVLVVDDDPGVGRALRLMLEDEHDVTSVTSAREALRLLLGQADFDVVFCDIMMPELTGMDLYQALRLNRPKLEQRLVFMTGGVFTPQAERFLAQVRNPRIEKPFDLKTLQALVRRAVRHD